ncbi:iron ABC transporter substrate-binding protein [Flexivirga sp. ID2601S]|uniref:Iron ABC transporter substrate-binding protein n=1 Tax=Flexivirga aerilata TaxID=1656889 RepID=A0A849APL9_9MICO|nr:iron ABC transporter substrate-binding protein [Flexivirga aerilata]NNG41288.1 iron ABC transporter substrate-binding protein [Flexivirga aerilata]
MIASRQRLRRTVALALPLSLALPLAACGSSGSGGSSSSSNGSAGGSSSSTSAAAAGGATSSSAAAKPTGAITVYNAQHESLGKEWIDGFTKATGVKVNVRNGSDTEMANQIVAEGKASPADVFLTENSPSMTIVENKGLFAKVDANTLADVPQQYRPSTGMWTGIAARSTVFAYDKSKLKPNQLPASIMDLAKPEWKGRWGASPSGADFQAIVSAMLQLKGKDATLAWLRAMKTNAKPFKGNSTVMKAVNSGQIDGGVIYHYYYFGDQAKTGENSKNVGLHYFGKQDPGAFVSVSGGGVLKSSKNPTAAQAFLNYVVSKQGQEVLQNGTSFEYPVGSQVPANSKLKPLSQLGAPAVDPAKLNSPEVVTLMQDAGLL